MGSWAAVWLSSPWKSSEVSYYDPQTVQTSVWWVKGKNMNKHTSKTAPLFWLQPSLKPPPAPAPEPVLGSNSLYFFLFYLLLTFRSCSSLAFILLISVANDRERVTQFVKTWRGAVTDSEISLKFVTVSNRWQQSFFLFPCWLLSCFCWFLKRLFSTK